LGERGGEINVIFRNAFDRVVLNGEDIDTVLQQEGENLQALMNETGAPCWAPDPPSLGLARSTKRQVSSGSRAWRLPLLHSRGVKP
jgi:hypothetical protein